MPDVFQEHAKMMCADNHIGIQAIHPGRKHQIEMKVAKTPVPPAIKMVGRKKPDITQDVRSGDIAVSGAR